MIAAARHTAGTVAGPSLAKSCEVASCQIQFQAQNRSVAPDTEHSVFESSPKPIVSGAPKFMRKSNRDDCAPAKSVKRTVITDDDAEDWLKRLPLLSSGASSGAA